MSIAAAKSHVGAARPRVDGPLKVSGLARYAAEFATDDCLCGYVVSGAIAKGRITKIDCAEALAAPRVIAVFTHETRPQGSTSASKYRDQVAPPGDPFMPLLNERIFFSGQPVALIVAEDYESARDAASLINIAYEEEAASIDVAARKSAAYTPPKKRSGIEPPPKPRGDAEGAFASAPVRLENQYRVAVEFHNPMEMHGSTVIYEGDGKLTIHDKTQGAQNTQGYVASVFGLSPENVRVISPFVGGAFGSGLRPQYQLFLAVMASLALERSVRVTLTRDQMFTFGYRPDTIHTVGLACGHDGRLLSVMHDAVAGTSAFEDYQENVVNWSGLLYACPNAKLSYSLTKLDAYTPADMRAPGATLGVFALESAMDELAYAARIDPLELRLRNYAERDAAADKDFTSKALRDCYEQGARRFNWAKRQPDPRSMREGRDLIGYGMATGVWEALMRPTTARARLAAGGRLEVATATADIGTGTYTILSQIAADALGIPLERVTALVGDSALPKSPVEGGSWAAASAGAAVQLACFRLRRELLAIARAMENSPLANADLQHVTFADGAIALAAEPSRRVSILEAMRASGAEFLEAEETAKRDASVDKSYSAYTHSAVFAEVRVDEQLGVARVTRVVSAVAAGKILNPLTGRSQIIGGVVMGIGMALHEEALPDLRLSRFMNRNLGEYHIPAHADICDIDVIFVDERDDKVSPMGVKGLGEIGIVGTAAAVANAIFHATGKRVRELPITIDKLL
ncbi:aldehyde oxidase and xanthine dehydrogenase molybdopterin binding [Methylocella silvestris BL2]|uniref:Aldehyde oxidase and xanthine dehydrogenase molybdopterin binding n=1 Tax=Methylocella silvestris (strain DSM 15510 / CIP 108128 / LMG 27833 / NCIMB 13906 / BL2) TaxID=395965 RepID=B8EIY2_METSB|nr:xanthine dehydrogenase family protein molybdopterin-binding subunit [Methylocella silvestris]ACK52474.1 aldehyde oxidase and xanthine dehydrogenase molybdopterin binding [Methylocella silvestris BL2]